MESNGDRFRIRPLKSEDVEEVARLLAKVFTEREPITSHLMFDAESFYSSACKQWTEQFAKEKLSLVCLDTSLTDGDRIVGFRLSQNLIKPGDESDLDANSEFNKKDALKKLFDEYKNAFFVRHREDYSNSIDERPKCFFFFALGVKDGYENCGIGSKLLEYSINHAKISGFEYIYVVASAAATQHMFSKKYHFSEVFSKSYEDIEYKGNHFLKGITQARELIGYELELKNWDIILHPISNSF